MSLRSTGRFVAVVGFCLLPCPTLAGSFCDDLKTMIAAAPNFASLRGEMTGSEFHGALKFDGSTQCEIRNKSWIDVPLEQSKWTYECLWEKSPPGALDWLKESVTACLPDAQYSEGSQFKAESWGNKYQGGVFLVGDTSVAIDFHTTTSQLWLTVVPAGVKD